MKRVYFFTFTMVSILFALSCKQETAKQEFLEFQYDGTPPEKYFRTPAQYSLSKIQETSTCKSLREKTLAATIETWESKWVDILSFEMKKFPYLNQVLGALEGIFLADFSGKSNYSSNLLGLTCQVGKNGKFAIFINRTLIQNRNALKGYLPQKYRSQGSMTVSPGDELINTFIHEYFHVLDMAYYLPRFNETIAGKVISREGTIRNLLFSLSWQDNKTSLFQSVKNYYSSSAISQTELRTEKELSEHFFKLLKETNLFDPLAAVNYQEDFAKTLEVVAIYKIYGFLPSVQFLSPLPNVSISTQKLLKDSKTHRDKFCEYMKLISNQTCLIPD